MLFSYIEDTTVAGAHAAGGAGGAQDQASEDAAQDAVSAASEELAAA